MHWTNDWDYPDNAAKNYTRCFENKIKPQVQEILTKFGELCLIWFDTPQTISPAQSQELYDMVKHYQPNCLVNSRIGNGLGTTPLWETTRSRQPSAPAVCLKLPAPSTTPGATSPLTSTGRHRSRPLPCWDGWPPAMSTIFSMWGPTIWDAFRRRPANSAQGGRMGGDKRRGHLRRRTLSLCSGLSSGACHHFRDQSAGKKLYFMLHNPQAVKGNILAVNGICGGVERARLLGRRQPLELRQYPATEEENSAAGLKKSSRRGKRSLPLSPFPSLLGQSAGGKS